MLSIQWAFLFSKNPSILQLFQMPLLLYVVVLNLPLPPDQRMCCSGPLSLAGQEGCRETSGIKITATLKSYFTLEYMQNITTESLLHKKKVCSTKCEYVCDYYLSLSEA